MKIEKIVAGLTPAEETALKTAFAMSDGSGFYPRAFVRMDVRRRLQAKKLISTRPGHPLLTLGLNARSALLAKEAR